MLGHPQARRGAGDNRPIGSPGSSTPGGRLAGRVARRLPEWLLPAENPSGAIYGLIVIGALLAAESDRHETYLDALLSATIAALLYWLAHSYAGVLGERLRSRRRLTAASLLRALAHDVPLIRGAAVPLLALVIAAVAGAGEQDAITVGVWSAIGCLVVFELIAGVRSGARGGELALECTIGLTMGLAILALKIVLH